MVLIIILTELVSYIDKEVSVPLRGLWFLSRENNDPRKKYMTVSVPVRGLWFLSEVANVFLYHDEKKGFRPLTGIMVLIPSSKVTDFIY